MTMKIIIGADHAGVHLKEKIIAYFKKAKIKFKDVGTENEYPVDYPDIAFTVAEIVAETKNTKGVLICGTGTGMVIAANKVKNIRAAVIYDEYSAQMASEHNYVNIACLRGRKTNAKKDLEILKVWLRTAFSKEARHVRRLDKIAIYERQQHLQCLR